MLRRSLVVVAIIALFAMSVPVHSEPLPREEGRSRASSTWSPLGWLLDLLGLATSSSDAGCSIDPDGGSCRPVPTPTIDCGASIDPTGSCRP